LTFRPSGGFTGIAAIPCWPERRKVKSGPVGALEATDRHERAKDYLSPAEMARLLAAAKIGRHGVHWNNYAAALYD